MQSRAATPISESNNSRRRHVRPTSLLLHSLEATSKGLLLLTPRAAGDAATATDASGDRPRPREAHHRIAVIAGSSRTYSPTRVP